MAEYNSLDDIVPSDIASEIGAELFGKSHSNDDVLLDNQTRLPVDPSTGVISDPIDTPPVVKADTPLDDKNPLNPEPRVEPGVNSETPPVNLKPLPKSWKKEMAPLWEKADPALHEYVYTREADVMRGIQGYAGAANNWGTLIQPFQPLFDANPTVNPIQLMQGLVTNHLRLLNPNAPNAEKVQLVNSLLQEYGITFGQENVQPADQRIMQDLQTARNEIAELRNWRESEKQRIQQEGLSSHLSVVQQFEKDPKNKYFEEVGDHIIHLLKTGAAADLPSAYELACWANPAVRAKMLAEQQAPVNPKTPVVQPRDKVNGQFVNLDGDTPAPRKPRVGSINDTIDAVVNAAYNPKH